MAVEVLGVLKSSVNVVAREVVLLGSEDDVVHSQLEMLLLPSLPFLDQGMNLLEVLSNQV